MKRILQRIFLKDINNYWYWIILVVIIKALFFIFMLSQHVSSTEAGVMYIKGGDTYSYITPVENLISNGMYSPDFRMPGYGALYFLFRLLTFSAGALNLLALTQLFLGALSVYFLALIARDIFEREDLFYMIFYGYLLSTYTSIFDIVILTESLAVSTLIFAVFCFVRGVDKNNNALLFLSGCFLTWCIFLRPFHLPLIGLFIIVLLLLILRSADYSRIKAAKAIIIFLLPFLLIDGAWVARNYKFYGRIIPLQKSTNYSESEKDIILMSLWEFLKSWGGDYVHWNPKAEITWFDYESNVGSIKKQEKDVEFPKYIYTSKFNYDSLVNVKKYIAFSKDESLPAGERIKFRQLAADKLHEYADSIKEEKPYLYYVYAPLQLFKKFLFHSGTYNLFNKTVKELNIIELLFKFLMTLIYLFAIVAGLLGITVLFFKEYRINNKFLVAAIPLYVILFFSIVFRGIEYRYFATAYPFMLICAFYLSSLVYDTLMAGYRK